MSGLVGGPPAPLALAALCLGASAFVSRPVATLLITAAIGGTGVAAGADAARPPVATVLADSSRGLAGPWRVRGRFRTAPHRRDAGSIADIVVDRVYVPPRWRNWPFRVRLSIAEPPTGDVAPGTGFEAFLSLRADRPAANPLVRPRQPLRATGNELRAGLKSYRQLRRRPPSAPSAWQGLLHGIRLRVRAGTEELFGERAPFVGALLLGERGELPPGQRLDYAQAGLAHLLAISGLHLGLLLGIVFVAVRTLGVPTPLAAAACLAALPFLLGVVVVRAAIARAAVMATVVLGGVAGAHRVGAPIALSLATLGAACRDPWVVLDAGFRFSTAATAAIVLVFGWALRSSRTTRSRHQVLTGSLVASWSAQLAVMPLVALGGHRVPLAGFWLNAVAVPLLGLLLALIVAALALNAAGLHEAARFTARSADAGMAALDRLAVLGSRRGGALGVPNPRAGSSEFLRMVAFDVGQGDALLVEPPGAGAVVIDTGGSPSSSFDPGSALLAPALHARGLSALDAVAVTHFHADHSGGLSGLLATVDVRSLWGGSDLPRLQANAAGWALPVSSLGLGHHLRIGPCVWTTHHPADRWLVAGGTPTSNDASWVASLECPEGRLLLTGDAQQDAEARVVSRLRRAPRTVLKVPHHGSSTSSTPPLIDASGARHAVVSAGWDNRFGLPAATVLERYRARQIALYRTDRDGAVTITWSARITVSGERWTSGRGVYRVGGWRP